MGLELYKYKYTFVYKTIIYFTFFITHMLKLNLVIKWVYNINLHVFMFSFLFFFYYYTGINKYSLFNLSLMCLHFQDYKREGFRRWRNRIGEG
jgi:hypothetical protein